MEKTTRNTRQRKIILEKLREVCTHPTADEIFAMTRQSLPKISLGTVYRNLELLAKQGDILCLENGGTQKRFDGNVEPHHHVRCVQCGRLGDIFMPIELPPAETVDCPGFSITDAQVIFEGICDSCKQ